jgi:hypothetical protein
MTRLPPATLIVTGFDQEDLIEPAIAGALGQDYPDLQIILTDDCSSDRTFSLMQEAAGAYRGPHKVVATRTPENRGTFGNIHHAFAAATGELILLAGGDDISYPDRARTTAERWLGSRSDAFYSAYDVIGAAGELIEAHWRPNSGQLWLLDYFPGQHLEPLHGASAACHRAVFEAIPPTAARIRSEDAYLTLLLGLSGGRIEYIDKPLVRYRRHAGAMTNEVAPEPTRAAVAERERTQMRFAASQRQLLDIFRPEFGALRMLDDDRSLFALRSAWDRTSLAARLAALPAARRRRQLRWLLPRLPGFEAFVAAKTAALAVRSNNGRTSRRTGESGRATP